MVTKLTAHQDCGYSQSDGAKAKRLIALCAEENARKGGVLIFTERDAIVATQVKREVKGA
jgi:hypothetical protein